MEYKILSGPESDYAQTVVSSDTDIDEAREIAKEIYAANEGKISHVAVVTESGRLILKY
jgi:CBS domain-containing protein